ncbi:unnamed protein product [Paramecium octaurelia]|uniref:Uncharacterized protein n=1 Tax=Paramecium octaurelia TaxID=43137 RepID=A0A8S1WD95_PAROT|nr:unnamed protein product [Paramecium octaurelia]
MSTLEPDVKLNIKNTKGQYGQRNPQLKRVIWYMTRTINSEINNQNQESGQDLNIGLSHSLNQLSILYTIYLLRYKAIQLWQNGIQGNLKANEYERSFQLVYQMILHQISKQFYLLVQSMKNYYLRVNF